MKRILFSVVLCGLSAWCGSAQAQDSLTLKDIHYSGKYAARGIDALRSTRDGRHYTLLERTSTETRINLYNYSDGKKVAVLFSDKGQDCLNDKRIFTYSLSEDGRRILLGADREDVFRRSYTGLYYVYDTATGTLTRVSPQRIQQPVFSPDGSKVAYSADNDLYYLDLNENRTVRITHDGQAGSIINGTADWVYEEEFAVVRMFDWSPSGDYIAYVRFDESRVPLYGMDVYNAGLYPDRTVFKYPKAGEPNSLVSLWIYDLHRDCANQVKVPLPAEENDTTEYYIPRLRWMPGQNDRLAFYVMPRLQNRLEVYSVTPLAPENATIVYQDRDDAYINLDDKAVFLPQGGAVFVSERDGYAHLYLQDDKGNLRQITHGPWQITAFYGVDTKNSTAYFQSTSQGSENRDICAVNLRNGKIRRLSQETGTNSAVFSEGFAYYINVLTSVDTPPVYTLNDPKDGRVLKVLQDNSALKERIAGLNLPKKRFQSLKTDQGTELPSWIMLPADFDSTRTYPLLMFVYGGPGSQQVLNTWYSSQDLWFAFLTQQGYIVACTDGRGTGGRGAAFEKTVYRRMGQAELEDQISAARILGDLPYVDKDRIGIFGWSFGGYMACLAATRGGDTWRAAVAVAPVTSWRFYDTIYTERYLATPQQNPDGYDRNSPLTYAPQLQSRLLLVHGTADDNVHFQNAMLFSHLLVAADRPFEQMVYPDKNHSIYGGKTRLHLFTKITDFILKNL